MKARAAYPPHHTRTMANVTYGWSVVGPYAHACCGSVVMRTFRGPWALQRALRWLEQQESEWDRR